MAKKSFIATSLNKSFKGLTRFFVRYWFRLTLAVLVAGGIFSIQKSIYADSLFWIRYFDIQTTGSLDHEKILQWSGLRHDMSIFDINLRSVEKRLLRHPEINSTSVRRIMPNRVSIFVSERHAFLQVSPRKDSKEVLTVDEEGYVIPSSGREAVSYLPLIVLPELVQDSLAIGHRVESVKFLEIKRFVHEVTTSGLLRFSEISHVDRTDDGTFEIYLSSGLKIFVQSQFREQLLKLVHFKDVLRSAETDIEYIDLRFSDVAIKRKPDKHKK